MMSYRLALACAASLAWLSAQPPTLEQQIEKALASPAARQASWGIHVVDLAAGTVLYARGADVPMTPASNTKLFTTALALDRLGIEYRFQTRLLAEATPDSSGRLRGDLRLLGGGDPSLNDRPAPYRKGDYTANSLDMLESLAAHAVEKGLRVVDGDIVGDDTRWPWQPYPESWSLGDTLEDYGSAVSALSVNENTVVLTLRAGKRPGDPVEATLRPRLEHFTLANTARTGSLEPRLSIDRAPGSRVVEIDGFMAPGTQRSLALGIDDPALYAAEALLEALRRHGVTVRGRARAVHRPAGQAEAPSGGEELARRESLSLTDILTVLDKESQNLYAEMLLREVGRVKRGRGTAEAGQQEMKEMLAGLGCEKGSFALEDGSGLSRRTLVAPACVTRLLAWLHDGPQRDVFWSVLPIAGQDGTLASRFRGLGDVSAIHAKTGSLSHVAALGGYAGLNPDHRIAFSILVNGYTAPASEVRAVMDRIAAAIAGLVKSE